MSDKFLSIWDSHPWNKLTSEDYEALFKCLYRNVGRRLPSLILLINPAAKILAEKREYISKHGEKAWEEREKERIDSMSDEERKFWGYDE